MSSQLNISINAVVQSGTGLAFIAYPEALSRMPGWPWLWQFDYNYLTTTNNRSIYQLIVYQLFCNYFFNEQLIDAHLFGYTILTHVDLSNSTSLYSSRVGSSLDVLVHRIVPTDEYNLASRFKLGCPSPKQAVANKNLLSQIQQLQQLCQWLTKL
uniref:Glyco_hydro_35 domain-containing protein n=1 Tax=Meloidogyne hapla TaxID=6305 RepID=A0A1I8B2E3_MELHA